jgi:hypothetical protein
MLAGYLLYQKHDPGHSTNITEYIPLFGGGYIIPIGITQKLCQMCSLKNKEGK